MSIDSARAFAERMKTDETFRQSVIDAGGAAEALEVARSQGFDFTQQEAEHVRQEVRA